MKSLYEEISYDLSIFGDVLLENKWHRHLIVKTLAKIPKDVRDEILSKVIFITTDEGVYGTKFSLNIKEPTTLNFILLNFSYFPKKDEEAAMYTISHEIGHVHLKHRSGGPVAEKEVDRLVEEWGFKRPTIEPRQNREKGM